MVRGVRKYMLTATERDIAAVEEFLSGLRMDPQLKKFKGFEEDLKGALNPTILLEDLFWEKKRWLDFEDFAAFYWQTYESLLRKNFGRKF
ncbi:MAG: hypothetical protein QXH20_07370, partial [Candidatus Bathyarchaeia archaeon]